MAIKPKLDFLIEVEKSISLICAHKWVLVKLETWCGSFPPEALKFEEKREINSSVREDKMAGPKS